TEYQLADMFTKALPEDRFKYLVRRIGMRCLTPAELEVVRLGINPMIQPEPEDLPKDNPKLEITVLRTLKWILFSIHNDEWKSFQCHHQTALRSQESVWKKRLQETMTELTLEESLIMFMTEIVKRLDENTNLIKEIQASMDFALRIQKASIKALEIQGTDGEKDLDAHYTNAKPIGKALPRKV
ncbi:hypothetical protein Tco_0645840, partial [Tanacetum coccineum]